MKTPALLPASPEPAYRGDLFQTPFGDLALLVDSRGHLQRILFLEAHRDPAEAAASILDAGQTFEPDPRAAAPFAEQLREYFDRRRVTFELPLAPRGTDFQREVWAHLLRIPYGETSTYSEAAERLGRPRAARAVGRANATNPLPILVPCHRLVGRNGSLTGFAGGLEFKRGLLELESRGAQSARTAAFDYGSRVARVR